MTTIISTNFPLSKLALLSVIGFSHCAVEIHFCHRGSKHASVVIQLPSLPTSDDLNNSNSPHLAVYYRFGKIDWMSSSERQVLLPLLHLPTLTSISLSSIRNFSLADSASCVNLKKLRIQDLECLTPNGVGNFSEALPPAPLTLERLTINEGIVEPVQQLCHARRPDGKPIIDFSSLKKIKSRDVQLRSMTELFGMCRNLQKISLDSMSLDRKSVV